MPVYASESDLIVRYGVEELLQLADRDLDGEIDQEVVTAALSHADRLIDAHLGQRYDLPLTAVPPLLTDLACDVARFRLHKDGAPEGVKDAATAAVRLLERIAAGSAALIGAGEEPSPQPGGVGFAGPGMTFTPDRLKDY